MLAYISKKQIKSSSCTSRIVPACVQGTRLIVITSYIRKKKSLKCIRAFGEDVSKYCKKFYSRHLKHDQIDIMLNGTRNVFSFKQQTAAFCWAFLYRFRITFPSFVHALWLKQDVCLAALGIQEEECGW